MSADLNGDTAAAANFLEHWEPSGPWVLTAIHPEIKGRIETVTFRPEHRSDLIDWIEKRQGVFNIYFLVNRPKRPLNSKAKKQDIGHLLALHVDVDPREDADLASEQSRIIEALRRAEPRPSIIIFSGGGGQAFWLMREAVITNDVKMLEAYNRTLEEQLGGDHCFNVDRIMRLPGTVNVPDRKKRDKGRRLALARVVEADWRRRYALDDFTPAAGPAEAAPATTSGGTDVVPDWCRKLMVEGCDPDGHDKYKGDRSRAVFAVACQLVRCGWSDEEIAVALLDPGHRISAHVRDQSRPEEYARKQATNARKTIAEPAIEELNRSYALILVGDKAAVLKEGASPEERHEFRLLSIGAFNQWLANRIAMVNGKPAPLARYWLNHSRRRQYEGLVFAPGREITAHYNLWRGFAVEPRPGDCSKFLAHVQDNACRGNRTLFNWVVAWFADIMQHPAAKCGTSLVLRGKMGTGKTKIGDVIGSLLGDHYVLVADPRYITGRFNSHLVSCLLLHADEGFWAGDKSAEGKLKDLITGDTHHIEFKGKEPIRVRNFVRLFVTGNPDWLVPAGLEERRFAVIEMGEARMQDHDYFAAIDVEMSNGGREALLHYLLNFDTSSVNLRQIPRTTALWEQKLASLTPEQGWWLDVLRAGRLPGFSAAPGRVSVGTMFEDYVQHAQKSGARRRSIETQLGIFLRKMVPGVRKTFEGTAKIATYTFPPLKECRAEFEKAVQAAGDWGDGPEEWVAVDDEPF